MHALATSSVRDLREAKTSLGHACMHPAACAMHSIGWGGPGGGQGEAAERGSRGSGGWVDHGGAGGRVWNRGRSRVESEPKSLKKLLLRDFYSFSPQQTFSPKKSPLFEFSVPKVPGTYEKVPATKQGLRVLECCGGRAVPVL